MIIEPSPIIGQVIGCGIAVHKQLGPGLLESAYTACLFQEFVRHGISVEREVPVPVVHEGHCAKNPYRVDFVVEGQVLLEVKAVRALTPVHFSQVITYGRLLKLRQGLLMNFNAKLLKDGLRRVLIPPR